jgi:hypothetical protein
MKALIDQAGGERSVALQKSLRDGDVVVLAQSDLREISSPRIQTGGGVREQSGNGRIVPGAD